MKKLAGIVVLFTFCFSNSFSQDKAIIQEPTLAVHFFYNDFVSAANVRSSSLASALKNSEFAKIGKMNGGVAVNYIQGLSPKVDFTSMLTMSNLDYPLQDRELRGQEKILLEADASVRAKLVPNSYWLAPYAQIGFGASVWNGYFGAFIPAGLGLQLNVIDNASIIFNSQYRIPVTKTSNYHFFYSVGFAGKIGNRKAK
jgi:OmpA-OmpF porin, OOP family